LIQNDSDIENRRPGSHVLGTLNILRSPQEEDTIDEADTIDMERAWDPYDRENLGHHVLYPVAVRGEIQKQNRVNGVALSSNGKLGLDWL
jgi:hypothetical protein